MHLNFSTNRIVLNSDRCYPCNLLPLATVRVRVQLGFEPRGWVYTEIAGCRVTASAAVAEWPRQSKRCLLRFGDRSYLQSVVISAAKYLALFQSQYQIRPLIPLLIVRFPKRPTSHKHTHETGDTKCCRLGELARTGILGCLLSRGPVQLNYFQNTLTRHVKTYLL